MAILTNTPQLHRWVAVARWTVLGTLGCLVGIGALNLLLFRAFGLSPVWGGVIGAVAISLLAAPLFFALGHSRYELARLRNRLNQSASVDTLTLCLDGAVFPALVDAFRTDTGGRRRSGALLLIDIDHFKTINERYGRIWGDEALRVIAGEIKKSVRSGDLVGRVGGEEFGVFLPGASRDKAETVAERIRSVIAETLFEPGGKRCLLTVSVGAVVFEDQLEFDDLYRAADQELHAAKVNGRNRAELREMKARSAETPDTGV